MEQGERRRRSHVPDSDVLSIEIDVEEGSFAIIVALFASFFVAGVSYSLHCSTAYDCIDQGTCYPIHEGYCSFRNSVTPAGFRIFNLSNNGDSIGSLTRGVCSPGERQNVDLGGDLVCVRAPSFPNAYMNELVDAEESTASYRNCGKWIAAHPTVDHAQYWSFFDEAAVRDDVVQDIKNEGSATVAFDDVSRFRAECERMIINSAVAPSALNAYEYLKAKMVHPSSPKDVLRHVGVLTSHYCDAPISIGITFGHNDAFSINATSGSNMGSDAASEALYALGESNVARHRAREFITELESAPLHALPPISTQELSDVLDGALLGTWVETSLQIQSPVTIQLSDTIETLIRFLHALSETSAEHAHAYLLACAAQCAFSTRAVVTGEFGANSAVEYGSDRMQAQRKSKPKLSAFGRLEAPDYEAERFSPVGQAEVFFASSLTLSMLRSKNVIPIDATTSHAKSACFSAASIAFADALDTAVLAKLTTPKLIQFLSPLVTSLKDFVAIAIQNSRISPLISGEANRALLATQARAVKFRIAGAPRGSEFGRENDFERPSFESSDGALLMLLKQANAVFLDRIRLALDGSDLCQHPPLYPSTSRNAYLLTSSPCAMLLPNILVPPFASDRYDQQSLTSRIGFVIAHEAAHVASKTSLWDMDEASKLLHNYTESTWIEAAADLTAATAIMMTGKVTKQNLCDDICQLWCARTTGIEGVGRSHPAPNVRGDNVCSFLDLL